MQKKGPQQLLSVLSIVFFVLGIVLVAAYFIPLSFTGFSVYDPDAFNLSISSPTPASGLSIEAESVYINLSSDASLDYAWIRWNGTNESMSGLGTNWYITKEGNGTFTYQVYGNFSDGNYSYTSERTISLGMAVVNFTIPNQTVEEDTNVSLIDIWNYTSSNKNDSELAYSIISETATSVVDCAVVSNRFLNCTLGTNVSGSSIVLVKGALYGGSGNISVLVNVTPVNDHPYLIELIPNQTLNSNETITLDLDDYFGDVESGSLNYSSTNPDNITFAYNVADQDVNLTADPGIDGMRNFTFIANDSANWTHSNMIFVNISTTESSSSSTSSTSALTGSTTEEVSVETTSFTVPAQTWIKNEDHSLEVGQYLPEEGKEGEYSVEGLDKIKVKWEDSTVTFTPEAGWFGEESATFKVVTDEKTYQSEATTLTVKDENHAPIISEALPKLEFTENTTEILVDLNDYFEDPDGDELNYDLGEALSINASMTTVSVATFSLLDEPVEISNETVEIMAMDPTGAAVSDEVFVTIEDSLLKQPLPWLWIMLLFVTALGITSLLYTLKRRGQLHLPHLGIHLPKFRFRKLKDEKPKTLLKRDKEQAEVIEEVEEEEQLSAPVHVRVRNTYRLPALARRGALSKFFSGLFAPQEVRYAGKFRQEALYLRESIAIMRAVMSASEDRLARVAMMKEKEKLIKAYNVLRQGLADTNIRKELLYLKEIKASLLEIRSISTDRLVREELTKIIDLLNRVLKTFYNEQEEISRVMKKSRRGVRRSAKK